MDSENGSSIEIDADIKKEKKEPIVSEPSSDNIPANNSENWSFIWIIN